MFSVLCALFITIVTSLHTVKAGGDFLFSACKLPGLLKQPPDAYAKISGSKFNPDISGSASFYQAKDGVVLVAEVKGLPSSDWPCDPCIFGFHIHEGSSCSRNSDEPFSDTKAHYNPDRCPHPEHAGDLPPLFGNRGYAFMAVFTDRFSVDEIINRTIVIHASPDDFTTQPSGNSGIKIACGRILPCDHRPC